MRHLLIPLILLMTGPVGAQGREIDYVDRIDVVRGQDLRGRLIGYEHGESATLVDLEGELHTIDWENIKRVYFQYDPRAAPPRKEETAVADTAAIDLPARKWRHLLSLRAGGTREERFDGFGPFLEPTYSLGASYHLLKKWNRLQLGPGLGYDLMSLRRQERILAATFLGRLTLSDWRIRPTLTLEAGMNLPLGSASFTLDRREVGTLIHPTLGVVLAPAAGQWGEIGLGLGYRISRVTLQGTNLNLEVVERDITYRRLTISATAGF
jgi:hypothetical protein